MKEQIQELATVMKSGNTSHKPNPPAVNGSPAKKFKRVNVKQNSASNMGADAREGLMGPEVNASGPFLLAKDHSNAISAKVGDMLKEFVCRI